MSVEHGFAHVHRKKLLSNSTGEAMVANARTEALRAAYAERDAKFVEDAKLGHSPAWRDRAKAIDTKRSRIAKEQAEIASTERANQE